MKSFKLSVIAAIFICTACLTSCKKDLLPSGVIVTESYDIGDVDQLDVSNAFKVQVEFSSTESGLIVEADDNLFDIIEVIERNGALSIGIKNRSDFKGIATLEATLKTNDLTVLDASGASSVIFSNKLVGNILDIDVSGASEFIAELELTQFNVDASGASQINVNGIATESNLELSGASSFRNYDFETTKLVIDASGASSAQITVNTEISVDLSGASQLKYKGDAKVISSDLSGASDLTKVE